MRRRHVASLAALLLWLAACAPEPPAPAPPSQTQAERLDLTGEKPAESTPPAPEAAPESQSGEGEPLPPNQSVTVYYRHPLLEGMTPVPKEVLRHDSPAAMAKQVIDLLAIAPPDGYGAPLWPENLYVREVYCLPEGVIVVDFDGRFIAGYAAGATEEELLVYSLVNSLLESFPTYDRVRLLVDGQTVESLFGHVDVEFPLRARYGVYAIIPDDDNEVQVEPIPERIQ